MLEEEGDLNILGSSDPKSKLYSKL